MVTLLYYGDDGPGDDAYAVEVFDQVEVRIDGVAYEGEVVKLHPRSHEVTVRYIDHHDLQRSTGEPRRKPKSCRAHVLAVDLIARSA